MVADLPAGIDVIGSAFATEIGNENDPLALTGGGFVWYDVANVTPSRERKLDEVKDRVEARWREDEIVKRLGAKTTDIMDKLKSGIPIADVAAAEQLKLDTRSGLKRQGTEAMPARVVSQIFRTAKDAVGSSEGQNATDRIIFRVTDIKVPAFDANSATVKSISEQLKNSYSDELMTQYVRRLETELGSSINEAGVSQAIGRTSN